MLFRVIFSFSGGAALLAGMVGTDAAALQRLAGHL
jgi:hypothetical protein